MVAFRTLYSYHQLSKFLKHQNPSFCSNPPLQIFFTCLSSVTNAHQVGFTLNPPLPISLFPRNFSSSAQLASEDVTEDHTSSLYSLFTSAPTTNLHSENTNNLCDKKKVEITDTGGCMKKLKNKKEKRTNGKKHLVVKGSGVVELGEKKKEKGSPNEKVKNGDNGVVGLRKNPELIYSLDSKLKEIEALKKKLQNLEMETTSIQGNFQHIVKEKKKKKNLESSEQQKQATIQSKPVSLHTIFTSKPISLNSINAKNSSDNKEVEMTDSGKLINEYKKKNRRKNEKKNLGARGSGVVESGGKGDGNGWSVNENVKNGDNVVVELNKHLELTHSIDLKLKEVDGLKRELHKLEMGARSSRRNFQKTEKEKQQQNMESLKKEGNATVESKPTSLHATSTSIPDSSCSLNAKNLSGNNRPAGFKQQEVSGSVKSKPLKKDRTRMKELSPEMVMLVTRWHEEGYLNKANFLPTKELDLPALASHYSRDFFRFAAEKFGQDHQEIANYGLHEQSLIQFW